MKKLPFIVLVFLILVTSCQKDLQEVSLPDDKDDIEIRSTAVEMIQLGKQLQNPYSVTNIQDAYDSLKSVYGTQVPNVNISITHKYVKFTPDNDAEYLDLVADTLMDLFTYPLDYEIQSVGGIYYHDPNIPDSLPTYHYAAIPASYIPNTVVDYVVLENLCIPEITPYYTQNLNDTLIDQLIDAALILTDNYDSDTTNYKSGGRGSYHPEGNISVHDDIVGSGTVPVENVQVRARRWFTVYTDRTDENGDFYMNGTFKRPCNYSLVWSTSRYYISNGIWFPAVYNGPKISDRWDLRIANNGKSFGFATTFRAGHRYHNKNIGGLKRPNVWTKLKIAYLHSNGPALGMNIGNYWQMFVVGWPGIPNILIWGLDGNGNILESDVIFSTTIHELGHASHISLLGEIQFIQVAPIIYESWATCVEWYITRIEYNEFGVEDYDDLAENDPGLHHQWWNLPASDYEKTYTPIFIDLFESYNQALQRGVMPADRCPDGGTFDGSNCFVVQPPYGESVFIYNYNFYYTPQNCCDCPIPGTYYDGANCFVLAVPSTSIPFKYLGKGYIFPAGDSNNPYDQVKNYNISSFEQNILKHSYGLSSLKTKLKEYLPAGMTERHIDIYMDIFFTL